MRLRHLGLTSSIAFHALAVVGASAWILREPSQNKAARELQEIQITFAPPQRAPKLAEDPPVPVVAIVHPPPAAPPPEPVPAPVILARQKVSPIASKSAKLERAAPKPKLPATAPPNPKAQRVANAKTPAIAPTGVTYVSRAALVYPASARRAKASGVVKLRLLIGAEGSIEQIKVLSSTGFTSLDAAAITCAKNSRYRPATREGRPIPAWVEASYRFQP